MAERIDSLVEGGSFCETKLFDFIKRGWCLKIVVLFVA